MVEYMPVLVYECLLNDFIVCMGGGYTFAHLHQKVDRERWFVLYCMTFFSVFAYSQVAQSVSRHVRLRLLNAIHFN